MLFGKHHYLRNIKTEFHGSINEIEGILQDVLKRVLDQCIEIAKQSGAHLISSVIVYDCIQAVLPCEIAQLCQFKAKNAIKRYYTIGIQFDNYIILANYWLCRVGHQRLHLEQTC